MIPFLLALVALAQEPTAQNAAPRPNFVFVLGEGEGWSSTSVDLDGREPSHARPAGLTPALESLAAEGVRMSAFYASCPRCTPSRASFLTGISPAKLHMTYVNEGGSNRRESEDASPRKLAPPSPLAQLPLETPTTASVLRAAGYATAHFGKWHVGRADPTRHGFELSDGPNSNQGPERGVEPNPTQSLAITERGLEFVRAQVKLGKPFFLQLSHYGVGGEDEVTPQSLQAARKLLPDARGKALASAAGMRDLDTSLARVLAALKELGIADETYVIYSADHGTPGGAGGRSRANPPLSGGKGSVSEGGVRVPLIVRGPRVRKGEVSAVRASAMDLLPTLAELAGAPLAPAEKPDDRSAVEGGSLVPVLFDGDGAEVRRPREELVVHFPHYDLDNGGPASALWWREWKLVRNYDTDERRLYDIVADREEAHDLAAQKPEVAKELEARLDAYLKAVDAQMPTALEDGGAPAPERRAREGKRKQRGERDED